jgi:KipI family sensor histidine kinase inhibitor
MDIRIAGENALIIYFGEGISTELNQEVYSACAQLEQKLQDMLIDLVPSYNTLLVVFNINKTNHKKLARLIKEALALIPEGIVNKPKSITLPVYYAPAVAPDLETVADHLRLTVNEVIELHSQQEYQVYAIGFAPGFAYLGELDKQLTMPRHSTPRLNVPRGSVAIAGNQTAVYPNNSPGGWHLIGRCPLPLFSPQSHPMTPFEVGDKVIFRPITKNEFIELGGGL